MPGKNEHRPPPTSTSTPAPVAGMDGLPINQPEDSTVLNDFFQRPAREVPEPPAGMAEKTSPQLLRLNTRLKYTEREYLIQSTIDPTTHKMRTDIFGEGVRLTAIEGEDITGLHTERIFPALKRMHERTTGELDRIFKFSQTAAEAHEPALLNYIGELFASREMWLEARREFDRAVLLAPEFDRALNNLGRCYLQMNLYVEAAEYLQRAIKLKPAFPDYLNRLGEVYLKMSSCRKAVDNFRQAAQLNPYFWEPYYNLGLTYILNGVRREDYRMNVDLKRKAMEAFEKAAVIAPPLRSGKYFLGQRFLEEDRLAEAYDAYTTAKSAVLGRRQPIPVSPMDLALCSEKFMPDEAELSAEIARLREDVRMHPHYADLRFRLAQTYTMLAQLVHRRAINEYDRALKINPDFTAARRNKKLALNEDQGMNVLVKATLRSGHLNRLNPTMKTDATATPGRTKE